MFIGDYATKIGCKVQNNMIIKAEQVWV